MKPANFKSISNTIVSWYNKNARDLPWRHTTDPYLIWVSEIILQQTTVSQGLGYYNRFVTAFPNIESLADAPEDKVLKLWQGLGYYNRAKNLHFTAKYIVSEKAGVFPNTYEEIISLKGIGPYTAAAIASFAYNLKHVVIDGNVIRIISRIFGIEEAVDNSATKKKIQELGTSLIASQIPQVFNQAIMEFGALHCTYKNPNCSSCPLSKKCIALNNEMVSSIPLKKNKTKKRNRFFKYMHIEDIEGNVLINKRVKKDIWQGLYEFPMEECDMMNSDVPDLSLFNLNMKFCNISTSKLFKQTLSHQWINAIFYKVNYSKKISNPDSKELILENKANLKHYAWPKVIDLYFNDLSITLF